MEKSPGKVNEFCQFENVGTMMSVKMTIGDVFVAGGWYRVCYLQVLAKRSI